MKLISIMIEAHIFSETKNGIKYLLLKRSEKVIYPGIWQPVTGKIKKKETASAAALREIKEETGIIPKKFWVMPNVNSFYNIKNDSLNFLPVFGALIDFNTKIKISGEHNEFGWYSPEEAKKILAWHGQKKSVDIITEYFVYRKDLLKIHEVEIKNNGN